MSDIASSIDVYFCKLFMESIVMIVLFLGYICYFWLLLFKQKLFRKIWSIWFGEVKALHSTINYHRKYGKITLFFCKWLLGIFTLFHIWMTSLLANLKTSWLNSISYNWSNIPKRKTWLNKISCRKRNSPDFLESPFTLQASYYNVMIYISK